MLIIRSDLRVADIYFGEFMRLFEHLYANLARIIKARKKKARRRRCEEIQRIPGAELELGGCSLRGHAEVAPPAVLPWRVGEL